MPRKGGTRSDSRQFALACEAALQLGVPVRFRARGHSMQPNILDGDTVVVAPAGAEELRRGDIALTRSEGGLRLHRVVGRDAARREIITRGDAGLENDPAPIGVLGKAVRIERRQREISLSAPGRAAWHAVRRQARRLACGGRRRMRQWRLALWPLGAMLLLLLVNAAPAAGQSADLSITSTAAPATVAPGGQITFTEVVTNNGPNTAATPALTQNTPANTTFVRMRQIAGNGAWTCVNPPVGGTGTSTRTRNRNMPAGNTRTFAFVVQVNPATANGTVITDSAAVSSTTTDPNPANNTASASSTVQTPDLSMTQTAAPNPVATGANITYTETVTNNSTTTAAVGATLTQSTPANTTFQSATPPGGWTCGTVPPLGGTGTIVCTANGTLPASSTTGNFTIVVAVDPSAPGGSTITNTATVSETGTDPNLANNTTTTTVSVSGADLSMTQTVSPSALAPGGLITYTETVTNNGPNAAVGAVLYQQTPVHTTFSSITAPAGWTCGTQPPVGGTGQVICTATGNVNNGVASGDFIYVVAVNGGTAAGTTIVNSADVTAQTSDPVSSNNATNTSVLVEVTGDADLAVSMTASPTPVFVSSTLTYTIQVQNLGLAAATGVTVTDTLPAALTGASTTTSQGSCAPPSGGQIVCTLNTVAYPLSPAITITITGTTPGVAGTLTNAATVSSTSTDPVPGNDTAAIMTVVQPLVCATPGKDGAPGTPLSGIVNTYYAGVGTAAAGATSITVSTPSSGSSTQIAAGDMLLVMQMQDAQINLTNTSSYGDGIPGDPASGSTNLGSSGQFEFVTVTAVTPGGGTDTITIQGTGAGGGLLNTYTSAAATGTQGIQTFQAVRVPQYTSATLSSGLAAFPWNGSVGGVLVLDAASQLTLGGTVSLDGQGFRGAGGRILGGAAGYLATDVVTPSSAATNGSKGEGVAGTPHYIAPALSGITPATAAVNTGQAYLEGLPNGSYARGAPGNAGGGATDANPVANDQNSGGGAGGNGGTGGTGGYGWNSAGVVGGFGGVSFPVSTSAMVMGGGGGAGTTNNGSWWNPLTVSGGSNCGGNCTGIYSSGTAGGGLVIIHAGSVTGTGSITANGQSALETENDGGGGGGAGGSIQVLSNSGSLSGLTASATGGDGGDTWPEQAPGPFPGNRHGPGGGGGGGVISTSAAPGSANVSGGAPGTSTLANDAYGATTGQPGIVATGAAITEIPGTQSGAYCAGADLAVTNSGTPNPVLAGGNITYTQGVTDNGPFDATNAVFTETIPANTTFQSIALTGAGAVGWSCTTPAVNGTGVITCTNPDVAVGANGAATMTVVVNVDPGTVSGTQIADTATVSAGSSDPNLANNSATVVTTVAAANSADLTITNSASPNPALAGANITYTVVVANSGPASAISVAFSEATPANTTLVSVAATSGTMGWTCGVGSISCSIPAFAAGSATTFTIVVRVNPGTASGTLISDTANVSSGSPDPNPANNSATVTVVVAAPGQADLAVTKSVTPNPVLAGNTVTYTISVTNNGPAPSVNVTLADTFPASTTFGAITANPPGTWTCPPPSGGTLSCTNPTLAPSTSTIFTLTMTVISGTAPGTVITNTATVSSSTTTDPYSGNNTATATTVVASPTQADVAILKTASPEPVDQGTNLTYTLQVTNNGPAVAQNVVVTDPLPSQVTFASVSIPATQGSCSQASGTVTCDLGTLSVGGVVIITINVDAATFSASSLTTNTATVSSSTSDPNLANNSSTATSTIQSPTAVQLDSLRAQMVPGGGVLVEWRTREETRNLGFHVYREDAQGRHRLDASLVAGSALLFRGGQPQHRARRYQWLDPQGGSQAGYWVEDVDLNGTSTLHGPVYADSVAQSSAPVVQAQILGQAGPAAMQASPPAAHPLLTPPPPAPVLPPGLSRASLETLPAVKIGVTAEGWYRVTRAQLVAAGMPANADARTLQLFAEGLEQPMLIEGNAGGPLGPSDSIEFYGTGMDTPFSGTRIYWLVWGSRPGKRIPLAPAAGSAASGPQSFAFTELFEQRTTYFAALLNGENNDNFFGALVTSRPVDQALTVEHNDPNSSLPITLDVTLQGVTAGQAHRVSVAFDGTPIGELDFSGQGNVTQTFTVDGGQLQAGANTVTLTALEGEYDVSLVQSIELHYAHTYAADGDYLRATAPAGSTIRIAGFSNAAVHVADITDPFNIVQLAGPVTSDRSGYGVTLAIPGSGAERTLLAYADDQIASAASLGFHAPSRLARPRFGADLLFITHPDFEASLAPLVRIHEGRGESVAVVTTDQIYDAFNYGEHSPYALRDFLQYAAQSWHVHPQAVLLVGDASFDPRDYLGFGDFDFVPTRMIETAAFKTASDDWLTDFQESGFAAIATGRLPVRTPADATLAVSKIAGYEQGASAGSWNSQALVIADQDLGADFTTEANFVAAALPPSLNATKILADGQDPGAVQRQILAALNSGALLVNYTGHGSEEQWSFADLFDDAAAAGLENGDHLPVFLLMDCLNGFFQDVYATSLSTSLMLAPHGGAVAVWASSGFTSAAPQATMDLALLRTLAASPSLPLGQAILRVKAGVTDPDVRRTWVLFGDPDMPLQYSATSARQPRAQPVPVRLPRPR